LTSASYGIGVEKHYYAYLMAFFQDSLDKLVPERQNHSGFYWSKRWWCGNGISWTICRSFAPYSR